MESSGLLPRLRRWRRAPLRCFAVLALALSSPPLAVLGQVEEEFLPPWLASNTSNSSQLAVLSTPNASVLCRPPIPCTEYLSDNLPCVTVARSEAYDKALGGTKICAAMQVANEGDINYIPATGTATTRCIQDWKQNGRCDLQNNHLNENCEYDGGDCCLATCQRNCANSVGLYERESQNCLFVCGETTSYLCLDDESIYSPITSWCQYGTVMGISQCYYTKLDVASALLECILHDRAHGNELTASAQCGNRTLTCTDLDVEKENGCHLLKEDCVERPCCSKAIQNGFIDASPEVLPTLREIYDRCETALSEEDEPCFKFMIKCLQVNRAGKGGCCQCDLGWSGWRCRTPLCWPKCKHGECVAPDLCRCEEGWKGAACTHAICDPECVPGQGTCVMPNQCECFYGWGGTSCEVPVSTPSCVNGEAVSPDLCRCAVGWGGRICDYPLCQSWPLPSPDCGHGTCMKPFDCECEPGWQLLLPLNGTGYDIPDYFSRGQDVSTATAAEYVHSDSRIIFLSFWDRIYNSSNAAKCEVPVCSLIYDPRCVRCDRPPGGCLECEPGFFVEEESGRCERCSNVFSHCQLCGYVSTGPEGAVVLRCTHCDPMFVLEPVAYGLDPSARCVSDGVIEFSSSVYHVYKNDVNVSLRLQRTAFGLEPSYARPVEVLVRTRDGTAHSGSLEHGGRLAGFEFSAKRVRFEVDWGVDLPSEEPGAGWGLKEYAFAVDRRIQVEAIINIPIYDNVRFFPGLRFFDVDLFVPPEHLVGHQGPLSPFLSYNDYETNTGYLPPMDFGRSPIYEQASLSTARVYIWDLEEASAPNTTCRGACQEWKTKTVVRESLSVKIFARTHQGQWSTSPRDRFIVKYKPTSSGNENAIGHPVEASRVASTPYEFRATYTPDVPGTYKLLVEKAVPGVFGEYWWHRHVNRKPPALPDVARVDHRLDFRWEDAADAPAFARWQFMLEFDCIRTERWPLNFGHGVAVHASPGSTVSFYFQNYGLVERFKIPTTVEPVEVMELNRSACERSADWTRVYHPAMDQFLCVELLLREPQVDPEGLYGFMVEYEPPVPTLLEENQTAWINLRMYHQNDTENWAWWPVQQGCLITSGLNIQGSPFEGFEALSGIARADVSDIKTYEDPPNSERVWATVDLESEVRVDLYDERGALVLIGPEIIGTGLRSRLQGLDLNPSTPVPEISWMDDHYRVAFTPLMPLAGPPDSGLFTLELHVTLDSVGLSNSPMEVWVRVAITDFWKTQIISGDYMYMKANERKGFRMQAHTPENRKRVTGGDQYWIYFMGPYHDPLPPELEFQALSIVDNDDGTYDVLFEIQRPGGYTMVICPTTTTTTTTTVTSTTRTSTITTRTSSTSTLTSSTRTSSTTTSSTMTTSTSTETISTRTPSTTSSSTTTSPTTTSTTTSTSTSTTTTTTSSTTSTTSSTSRTSTTSTSSTTSSTTSTSSTTRTSSTSTTTTTTSTTTTTLSTTTTSSSTTTTTSSTTSTTSTTTTLTTYTGSTTSTTTSTLDYNATTFSSLTTTSSSLTTTTATTTTMSSTTTSLTSTSTSVSSTTTTSSAWCIEVAGLLVYDTLSAPLSTAYGPGVDSEPLGTPVHVTANEEYSFDVIVRDTYEVQYYEGGAQLRLHIGSLDTSLGDFTTFADHGDGRYTFTYQVCKAGLTQMKVELLTEERWQDIAGSPFDLEVVPRNLYPVTSTLDGLAQPLVQSGIPTSASFTLRDSCGNLPIASVAHLVRVAFINTAPSDSPGPGLEDPDILETSHGKFTVFFTPARRGLHELSVILARGSQHITGSPFHFEVVAAGHVPTELGAPWVLGAIGASSESTFEIRDAPGDAGSEAKVEIVARDLWGDPLALGNDTFLLGLWREEPVAQCLSLFRCAAFAASAPDCGRVPRCRYDEDNSECRPRCPTPEEPAPFTLADPAVSVKVRSVQGSLYTFGVNTSLAGTYYCTASVLRPGGLRFYFYESELMYKRVHTGIVQGSADYSWGLLGPPGMPVPMARFSARVVGWLRVQVQDRYTIYLDTDGSAQLYLNDTLVIDNGGVDGQSIGSVQVVLRAGFTPLYLVYHHVTHVNCPVEKCPQDVGVYLRLAWSARTVPYEVVPLSALYYEEALAEAGNPAEHVVRPLTRASDLALQLDVEDIPTTVVGTEIALRLHSVDAFGNLLRRRDPAASLRLLSDPPFAGGTVQGDALVADRWRLVPLANGSWDLLVLPDAAPMAYDLTLELSSREAGGLKASRGLRIAAQAGEAKTKTSKVVCMPQPPQLAGTRVTCTSMPYDLEGNEVVDTEISVVAESPNGTVEGTRVLPAVDNVGRVVSFMPEVPGNWTVRASVLYDGRRAVELPPFYFEVLPGLAAEGPDESLVAVPSQFVTDVPFDVEITPRDRFGNRIDQDGETFRVHVTGGYKASLDTYGQDVNLLPDLWKVQFAGIYPRTSFHLDVQLLVRRHNESLSACPELLPRFGRVSRLSDFRALGSVALLECLPGFTKASGADFLRCEPLAEGLGEWRDAGRRQASILVCRHIAFYCPPVTFVDAELVWRNSRREIGSRALVRCMEGHDFVLGDVDLVCGSRGGKGVWLNRNGDEAARVVCTKPQHKCPPLEGTLTNAYIVNMSADRDLDSVVYFGCLPGYEYAGGSKSVFCGLDGEWKRPEQTTPGLPFEAYGCAKIQLFCPEPSPLLGLPEKQLEFGARLAHVSGRELGASVGFECLEGYQRLLGDMDAICAVSRRDDSEGRWVHSESAYGGQVDVVPLRCALVQDWCPNVTVEHGLLVSMTHERYLRSIITFKCDSGYEPYPGTKASFRCGHNYANNMADGAWYAVEDDSPIEGSLLRCRKIEEFCPSPVGSGGVTLSRGRSWPINSEVSMQCNAGYEPNPPPGLDRLTCRPSSNPVVGQWVQHDGFAVPASSLTCRSSQGYCPIISLQNGRVFNVEGARDVADGRASLACNVGYRLWIPVTPTAGNGWKAREAWDDPAGLPVRCTQWNATIGLWRDPLDRETTAARCISVPNFCSHSLPVFTRRTDMVGDTHQLPLTTTFVIDGEGNYRSSYGKYAIQFQGSPSLGLGSTATLTCNEELKYHYSFGDDHVVCGLSADGTRGAWRSLSGILAVPLRCYYSGTPISDADIPPVMDIDGCFVPEDLQINYEFGRSGALLFWLHPTEWPVGSMIIQGTHGDSQWQAGFVAEGILEAQVSLGPRPDWHLGFFGIDPDSRVGHVRIDLRRNETRGLLEWYHVAFVWDLGLGLAGLGEVKLWVDGELAEPVTPGSDHLDHYVWVEPEDQLRIGASLPGFQTTPGDYSNLRVYGRNVLEAEINAVRGSEEPRCGFFNGVCDRPMPFNAKLINVDNTVDPRFALFPLRPESTFYYECDPGYTRVEGDSVITCHTSGAWLRAGTTSAATLLQCCRTAPNFCPPVTLLNGSVIAASYAEERTPCAGDGTFDPMGVSHQACPELAVSFGSATYSVASRAVGSSANLACDEGYESENEMVLDTFVVCTRGTFDARLHPDGAVPSAWRTPDGREPQLLRCQNATNCTEEECDPDPYYCDTLSTAGHFSYVANATLGRQLGSTAFFHCLNGYVPESGNVTLRCVEGLDGGSWVDSTLQRNATALRCRPKQPTVPAADAGWAPPGVLRRRFMANASLACLPIMLQVHGDNGIYCALGPGVSQPCTDRVEAWTDSLGFDCQHYRSQGWCTEAGGYGPSWHPAWGHFEDYAASGHWAPTACCACGGGDRGTGVLGRWVDAQGDAAELPICTLNMGKWEDAQAVDGWCPEVDVSGRNSLVAGYSKGFGFSSVASLRCRMGYEKLGGHAELTCVNNPDGEKGAWDREALRCGYVRHFCPPMRPVNASIVEPLLNYTRGEVISMRCHRGFEYLSGDFKAVCEVSDAGFGGQWRRMEPLDDDGAAEPLVCAPVEGYCSVPPVEHGFLESLTLDGGVAGGPRLGSVAELRCRSGFRDLSINMDRRTVLCLHDDGPGSPSQGSGDFFAGLSWASRDMLRTISAVHDIIDMLEESGVRQYREKGEAHAALDFQPEDDDAVMNLRFEARWKLELTRTLEELRADRYVKAVLAKVPDSHMFGARELPHFTLDHLRMLHRLLVDMAEEKTDIAAEEARDWYGAYAKLRVSFQDSETPAPEGWLRDLGEPFGYRGNGFRYGWKCDVSATAINRGAFNRNRSVFTALENTLIMSDPYSSCTGQEWRIRLPSGRYHVEVTVQDPMFESNASGIFVQGENLGFPAVVKPPGTAFRRSLLVDVLDYLSLSCDRDTGCSTVNRIAIQHRHDVGARPRQRTLLQCAALADWCPPVVPPPHSVVSPEEAAWQAMPLGSEVRISCVQGLVASHGLDRLVCAADARGTEAQWRAVGGGQAANRPPMACARNRTWCPPVALPASSRLLAMDPPWPELGSTAQFACPLGSRRNSSAAAPAAASARCSESGAWCTEGAAGCQAPSDLWQCAAIQDYCPELRIPSAERVIPAGLPGEPEERPHTATTLTTSLPIPPAPLGAVRQSRPCPPKFHRVHGSEEVVCAHGAAGGGTWQPLGATATTHLVDAAAAEGVLCELDGRFGVRRTYFASAGQLHNTSEGLGQDVVPNIDQHMSDYDAAYFETNLDIPQAGLYTLGVEVVGKFVLSLRGRLVLAGRSRGASPEHFASEALRLEAGFVGVALQYELDPILFGTDVAGTALVPRLVRLLWQAENVPGLESLAVVPATELYHTFRSMHAFPRIVSLTNDPDQCASGFVNSTGMMDLKVNDTGILFDGTLGREYNQDVSCTWLMVSSSFVRVNFFIVDEFDIERTPGCLADRLEIRLGTDEELFGRYCGTYAPGEVLTSAPDVQRVVLRFITDSQFERPGFSIRYVVVPSRDPPPPGLPPEEQRRLAAPPAAG